MAPAGLRNDLSQTNQRTTAPAEDTGAQPRVTSAKAPLFLPRAQPGRWDRSPCVSLLPAKQQNVSFPFSQKPNQQTRTKSCGRPCPGGRAARAGGVARVSGSASVLERPRRLGPGRGVEREIKLPTGLGKTTVERGCPAGFQAHHPRLPSGWPRWSS